MMTSKEKFIEKARNRYFKRLIGRVWFSLVYFIAIGVTFAVALGCFSPATQMFHLYNTGTNQIISYLSNATHVNETQLHHPDLPDYWSWGLSGCCEIHTNPPNTRCYQAFPPLFSTQDLVAKALADSKSNGTDAIISAWNSALASKPSDPAFSNLADSASRHILSESYLRGAAALTIISLLINFGNLIFSAVAWPKATRRTETEILLKAALLEARGAEMSSSEKAEMFAEEIATENAEESAEMRFRWNFFGLAILDSLILAGGIVCFTYAMTLGQNGLTRNPVDPSGGLPTNVAYYIDIGALFVMVGFILKLFSVPILALIAVCILGFELFIIAFVLYLIWMCFME